ncbi:MAG: 1-(5-phosphoribosyl)-5-[(5-phosphoribosylamino)methylideneamino]imidazole-4-carboxamide isomerase [Candidatus Marinimicrobia bacterium]|nr:1-(5-phosphoribosyl)-5-[(5-phosphoribosylamino)methylideneamino]imidazole-4-carboxamide isomerase [Candidatus Neomarinimicrobiota bacterium]
MIEIIPAIDIIDGACVRLTQGEYNSKKIYDSNPLNVAKRYEDAGILRLHCVDLDAAKAGHIVNGDVLETICSGTKLAVDFGGGIKSDTDIERAFSLGAKQITAGSIAAYDPQMVIRWLKNYGQEKIILGADFKYGRIAVSGWQEATDIDLWTYLDDYITRGIKTVISTDISKDGMLEGSSEKIYQVIKQRFPDVYLIASGGISCMDDIRQLNDMNIDGVIVGKAIYEERITLKEITEFMRSC